MNDSKGDDFLRQMGAAALGAWLRRLSERVDREAARIYEDADVAFEQRWFGILNQLALHGARSVGDIAAALGVSHAAVSQSRASLEKAELVVSQPDPNDGRSRTLRLTPKGQQLYLRMAPLWEDMAKASAELDREAGGVVAALARLEQALDRTSLDRRVRRLAAPGQTRR